MLLSDRDIKAQVAAGRLRLDPYEPSLLQPSSIDVRLDRYFRVFNNQQYTHIDPALQQDDLTTLVEPKGDEPFVLHPGEFVLGSTLEVVTLPDDLAGRLEGKALAVDTPIPTPSGMDDMGGPPARRRGLRRDRAPAGSSRRPEVMLGRPCCEVVFSDGQVITADVGHLWLTTTSRPASTAARRAVVGPPREIGRTLRQGDEWNHHVAAGRRRALPDQEPARSTRTCSVPGSATARAPRPTITCGDGDGEMLDEIERRGYPVHGRPDGSSLPDRAAAGHSREPRATGRYAGATARCRARSALRAARQQARPRRVPGRGHRAADSRCCRG